MYVCGHVAGEEPNKLFDLMWLQFEEKTIKSHLNTGYAKILSGDEYED